MTPWTGHPGEPVPVALRHDFGPGRRCGTCTACGAVWVIVEGYDVSPCPVAVAQRLAELEAHEASMHKYGAHIRRELVRWLEHVARTSMGHAHEVSRQAFAFSARIERGDDARWCEAHPVSPAPVGADAGRDPGREE